MSSSSDSAMENQTVINDLELACLARIFSLLPAKDCARAACVHSLWNSAAGDDAIWRQHIGHDFAVTSAVKPDDSPAPSFRSAYNEWHTAYADVAGPLLTRTLTCWKTLKTYLADHSPGILATLNPGASREELAAAEQQLGHPLPLAVRCIYRVCNGQELKLQELKSADGYPVNLMMGLLGTTLFYDNITSTALKPLGEMVQLTQLLRSIRPMGARHPMLPPHHVVFACSFRVNDKLCVLDADSGAVYLKLHRNWPLAPAQDTYPGACDGALRWMEEYASRLSSGWYGSCESDSAADNMKTAGVKVAGALSLFPRTYPAAATAITRGVQVSWSSVLVPQESRQGKLMFTYSVKFTLLTPQQEAAALQRLENKRQQWQQRQQAARKPVALPAPPAAGETAAAAPDAGRNTAAAAAAATSTGADGDAVAAASTARAPLVAYNQQLIVGPCDASAGPSSVPAVLMTSPSWQAAAVAAAGAGAAGATRSSSAGGSSGSTGATAAPAGAADDVDGNSSAAAGTSSKSLLSSCQLVMRNWRIFDSQRNVLDTVSGEGVVGLHPLLVPNTNGIEEFSYASCTYFPVNGGREQRGSEAAAEQEAPERLFGRVVGAMEGSFTFVEGSMMQRMGGEFEVQCPRLVFAVPDYLY